MHFGGGKLTTVAAAAVVVVVATANSGHHVLGRRAEWSSVVGRVWCRQNVVKMSSNVIKRPTPTHDMDPL